MSTQNSNNNRKSLLPKQPFEDEDDDSWQVSYLDIVTILLGFFVVLLSISQITDTELRSVSNLFKSSIVETEFITTPIEEVKDELELILNEELENGDIEIFRDLNDIQITFRSDDLYRSGSATLQPGASGILNRTLEAIQEIKYTDFKIDVQGHTDDTPISSSVFPSNWELSTTRASNVVKYFTEMGIDKSRLKASGYADSQPIAPNTDSFGKPIPENRDLNRRVVLNLYYSSSKVKESEANTEQLAELENPTQQETNSTENTPLPSERIPSATSNSEETATDVLTTPETLADNTEPTEETEPALTTQSQEEQLINKLLLPKKKDPEPVDKETSEQRTSTKESFTPVIENMKSSCSYAVQIGGYQELSNSIQISDEAKRKTGYNYEVNYSNKLFSVRTNLESSFKKSLDVYKEVSGKLSDSDIALIQQCYDGEKKSASNFQYQIQFGAFQDRSNALSYALKLFDEYSIQAYMNRASQTYNVVAGPYPNRASASEQLQTFKKNGVEEDIFVKLLSESDMKYKIDFQLQLATFANQKDAQDFAVLLFNQISLKTIIKKLDDRSFYVITENLDNWNQTLSLFRDLSNSRLNFDPVIFLKEGV